MAPSSTPTATHRLRWIAGGLVLAAVVAVVVFVFEPQTLFIDTRVDDAFPATQAVPSADPSAEGPEVASDRVSEPDAAAEPTSEPAPVEPVALAAGEFVDRDHPTSGTATVFELEDGSRVLRFDDLVTDNGPDLKVYLSTAAADGPSGEFDEDFVDLGVLAGNLGNQNYEIASGVDVSRYASVVIWCDRFDVPFGASPLALQRAQ